LKAKGHPTERVSTGARFSMPRAVIDDYNENEVEVTNHERLPKVTRHGAVGYMKRWKEKHFIKEN
jgi:hypothetical protein